MSGDKIALSTRERQAQQKRKQILTASITLFEKKCIEDTSIEEIAKHAGVGAATVYRYFSTKIELVIETAGHYWEQVAGKYLTELERAESVSLKKWSGYQRLEQILHIFCRIFEEEKAFLKFLQEFDVFVKKYGISKEGLSDYEDGILKLKPYVTNALETGLEDRSLTFSCSVDEMYFSLTHTLLSLMEKLAVGGDILTSDQMVEGNVQLQVMTRLILKGLTQNGSDYE